MSLDDVLKTFQEEREVVLQKEPTPKFVEKDKFGVSLKGVLQRGRLKLTRQRKPHRAGVTFRPSMITYSYCRRLKIGQLAGLINIYDKPAKPRQQIVFDMGNAMHDIIQAYFWDIGILKGSFKCIKCDRTYHDLVSPKVCPSGKQSHGRSCLSYREVVLKEPQYLISGRADGILVIEGEDHIMDIKSIQNKLPNTPDIAFCFEDLKERGPKSEHIVQINLYMWITGIRRGHLLYVAKNNGQILTFAIPYDESVIEPYLREIRELIEAAEALKAGTLEKLPAPCGDEACLCHTILLSSKT